MNLALTQVSPIIFRFIAFEDALQAACLDYNNNLKDDYKKDQLRINPEQITSKVKRITINYLRHQSSNYDQLMTEHYAFSQARKNRLAIRKTLFTIIASNYPQLRDQALQQRGNPADFTWPVEIIK
jgi:hypothetical protein